MKKFLLLACVAMSAFFTSKAQNTFAPIGAEWWYAGNNFDYNFNTVGLDPSTNFTWTDQVQSVDTATMHGVLCQKLKITRTQKNSGNSANPVIGSSYLYVYNNPDTVFIYSESDTIFRPLYIFNTNVGDTVKLHTFRENTGLNVDSFSYVLDSVKMEMYDATQLKTYYTHGLETSVNNVVINWGISHYNSDLTEWQHLGKFTEKLGGNLSFLPTYSYINADGMASMEYPGGIMRCYSEDSLAIKLTTLSCDSLANPLQVLAINELSKSGLINIFPNPAKDQVTLSLKNALKNDLHVNITDIAGHQLQSVIVPKQTSELKINVASYPSGIYLMTLESGGERYYHKLVIEQ